MQHLLHWILLPVKWEPHLFSLLVIRSSMWTLLKNKASSNLQAGHSWCLNCRCLKNRYVWTKISYLKKCPKAYVVFGQSHDLNGIEFITLVWSALATCWFFLHTVMLLCFPRCCPWHIIAYHARFYVISFSADFSIRTLSPMPWRVILRVPAEL